MIPSEVLDLLTATIRERLPVLIVGGPGTAKTSLVAQAAAAAGADLIVSHPAVKDPTDMGGLPWADSGGAKGTKRAVFIPIGETAKVLESKRETVWLWDDFGQATPATQASGMPWLLARENNGNALPKHVTIIATTNRRTDRAGVSGLLEPVKSRFATIVEFTPDLDEWCQWAMSQQYMQPEIVAYLRFQPDMLYKFEPTADLTNCPLPRTWENAARVLACRVTSPTVEAAALAGAIGMEAATKFLEFRTMYKALPTVDGILISPKTADIPTRLDIIWAVVSALAFKATEINFPRICIYAERMEAAGKGEYAAYLIHDIIRRLPEVQVTPAFPKLMSSPLGKLLGGGTPK